MRRKKINPTIQLAIIIVSVFAAGYLFLLYGFGYIVNLAFQFRDNSQEQNIVKINRKGPGIRIEPVLRDLPYATNSASIVIEGIVAPETDVYLYQNGTKVHSVRSGFDGKLSLEVILEPGENILQLQSVDKYENKRLKSRKYKVLYLDTPPDLQVDGIEDGKVYKDQEITIGGVTEKEVFVEVNNSPVVVHADGRFQYTIRLKQGENTIKVSAVDVAGNEVIKEYTVEYKKD